MAARFNKNIEIINEFQYIGSIVMCDNNINVEINHRIIMGNVVMGCRIY
jgi:hypothetical protein